MKKSSAINEKLCQGKDVFERMNYLHQASLLVSSQNIALASYYGSILTGCAKKSVLRIEHNLKRSICKACQSPIIPGETAKVRLMQKKKKLIKTVCRTCNSAKKIPTRKKHNLWLDQPQSVLQTFEYDMKKKTNAVENYTENVKKDNVHASVNNTSTNIVMKHSIATT